MLPEPSEAHLIVSYQSIVAWAIPPLLVFALRYLQQIAARLGQISEAVAVVITKIDIHERRLDRLEDVVKRS